LSRKAGSAGTFMIESQKHDLQASGNASAKGAGSGGSQHENQCGKSTVSSRLAQFEKKQNELWRVTFFLLIVLATVFALVSWDTVRSLTHRYEALPVGLVILVGLFGAHVWKRTQEISELRGLVQGIEQRDSLPPDEKQMNQLFDMISRSQQGYRDLIDSFDDILIAVTLEGEIRAVNRSFADLVATPFQEIIGKSLTDFAQESSGDGREIVRKALPKFMERRTWSGVVHVHLKNQQGVFYFDCVANAMLRDGQVHGVTILARDVSALRKNEARFTELFETLQEGIYIINPTGAILDVNPALVRMLGYDSKEDLLAHKVPDIFHDRAERKSIKNEVERQAILQGREITLTRKDGTPLICLNTAAAVRDSAGTVIRYQGALMDVTASRVMERRLHQQQEFARRLIDSFPDLIFVLDNAANYTFVSPRVIEVLGYQPEEIMELELGLRTNPEDRAGLRSMYQQILDGHETFASLEVRVRNKKGELRRLRCHFSPLFDENDKIDGVIISGRDVTDLKRLEEQLIQAEKLAAMGQMLAGVAHELNNPLTAILGVTELLRERQGADETTQRQLELTHRQARRAARIVQNLLEFSRPASPQKKPLDVNVLVERTLQLQEHSLRRNQIAVDFEPQRELPPVLGDGNQLIQVLLNLITNAEQAIREVRESGNITIRLALNSGVISITVQDDGVGIPPEALPRIFDPFYTTKRPGGGTGLGLSICMSIIREHGGNLDAKALPAGGTLFTLDLPALSVGEKDHEELEATTTAAAANAARATPKKDLSAIQGCKLMVIDDEESIRMLLEEGLSAHGLEVDCAANSEAAVALAHDRTYDILLCDLNLSIAGGGKVSGREVVSNILNACGPEKPSVIFMTGDLVTVPEHSGSASISGEPRLLQKPFRISDVLATLHEVCALKQLETPSSRALDY
jgi:PAS domain S-box-containing protein